MGYYYLYKDTGKTDNGKPDGTPIVIPNMEIRKLFPYLDGMIAG